MVKILELTPFGFVMEIQNDYAYYCRDTYELYLDNQRFGIYDQNVVSVFGLSPGRLYNAELRTAEESMQFKVETRPLNYLINIHDYNAAGDGKQDDTAAINTAIYTAPRGAVVYIPKGTYLVNQIYLKSGVDIYLAKGSLLKQNINRNNLSIIKGYQKNYHHTQARVNTSWEGSPLDTYGSLLFGYEVEDIKIYGEGTIDGNGAKGGWWENAKVKNVAFRPKNLFLNHCKNITVSGIKSQNSACWNMHPFYCETVNFYGLSLVSEKDSPNTDGINPESCKNVSITGCHFDVGDDCIAIKSGKYFMSQFAYQPCEKINIRNCYMGNGHGGIAIGSEISCGVRDLRVEKCYMDKTDRGVRIKSRRGRGNGSILKNISLVDLEMNQVCHCLGINMFYHCDPDGKSDYVQSRKMTDKDKMTPKIQDIEIARMKAGEIRGCAVFIYGLPESRIDGITIRDSSFTFAQERIHEVPEMLEQFEVIPNLGIFIKNADAVKMTNNQFNGEYVSILEEENE